MINHLTISRTGYQGMGTVDLDARINELQVIVSRGNCPQVIKDELIIAIAEGANKGLFDDF